jgi:predicted ATPase/DNA-binding CsgD family transcriptional regulator
MEPLAAREIQILSLISEGLSNREISQKLYLTTGTVKWYNKQIFRKLGVSSRTQAAKMALEQGILEQFSTVSREEVINKSGNLPAPLTSFVGRIKEIAEIKQLLKSNRLVVLTGTGGSGKTRLALQVAAELSDNYHDGAWLVELAPLSDPNLVTQTIAQVLKVPLGIDASPGETLKRFLARKQMLLLLDNFEHLLEASPWVGQLLAAAPHLAVLATSREPLHVYGENQYQVQPLKLPSQQSQEPPKQLLAYEAIDLFVQRAQAVRSGFTLDERQAPAVTQICLHLDGLPLAIELAASQLKIFPPNLLAQQMETDLGVTYSGPHNLPERQRTLQATIEWSYNLLEAGEKALFARLAVFSGGGTIEGIREICGQEDPRNLLTALYALVEKNLVISREGAGGELRFSMLETIHEFANKCLLVSGEMGQIQRRHAQYFTHLAESAELGLLTAEWSDWLRRLQAEQGNLNSAFSWSFHGGQKEYGLRLVAALREYWYESGTGAEGQRWTELAVARSENSAPQLRAAVLRNAGYIAYMLSNIRRSKEMLRQALDLYQTLGDEGKVAWTIVFLSLTFIEDTSEYPQGIRLATQALDILRKLDDKPGMSKALTILGELARLQGDYEAAWHYYEDGLAIAKEIGLNQRVTILYNNLALVAYHQEEYELAIRFAHQSIHATREIMSLYQLACIIKTLAGPVAALGKPEHAARLLGISHEIYLSLGCRPLPTDQPEFDRIEATVRKQLGEQKFQKAFQAGQAMPVQEIIPFALEESD